MDHSPRGRKASDTTERPALHCRAGRVLVCAHGVWVGPSATAVCDTVRMTPPAGAPVLRLLLRTRAGRGWYAENKVFCHQIRLVYPGLLRAIKFLMLAIW